jgi:antitoxin ParD1/3/4
MVSLSISLPDRLKAYVDGKIANGVFKDASEYLTALIHADAHTSASDRLDALLLEGIESAEQPWDAATRDAIRGETKPAA